MASIIGDRPRHLFFWISSTSSAAILSFFSGPREQAKEGKAPSQNLKVKAKMEELTEVYVDGHSYQMSITTQPPLKTVYQRILKPFPTVTLTLQNPQSKSQRAGNDRRRSRRRSQPDTDDEEQQAEKKATTVKTEKAENEEIDADYADMLGTHQPGELLLEFWAEDLPFRKLPQRR